MITVEMHGESAIIAHLQGRPEGITKAMVRALNRSIGSARTVMVREIAHNTGLKSKDVRDKIPLREATFAKPEASIGASLKRLPLYALLPGGSDPRGPYPSRGRRVLRIRGKTYDKAFIAKVGTGGHWGVFVRRTKKRLPIRELFTASLGWVFRKFRSLGVARARETFEKNFAHELEFQASQGAGAASAGAD